MIGRARFAFTVLGFGYAFLYLPLVLVMLYSFNESRLVTVWGGFSTKWWGALFTNDAMLQAAWLSLRIAAVSATLAAVVGLAAGYALSRAPSFPGRGLLGGLVIAPMVMPEVVMGISMLLLFVGAERLFGGPFSATTQNADLGASRSQPMRHRAAKDARAAGDNGNAALEREERIEFLRSYHPKIPC